jgi:putative peptidoglycan lipid II flippase
MYLPSRIFGTTVGQASLPMLSKNIARNELDNFRQTVNKILLQSLFIALPVSVLILVQRLAIVRLLFGSHEFPWSATLTTARILAFLTPAIICQAIIQILIRAFYALHNTKVPFKVSFWSLLINVSSSFLLINYTNLEVIGLAISSTLGNITQLVGLFYFFVKIVDGFDWTKTLKKVNKILFASLIMGISTWLSLKFLDLFILDTTRVLPLIIVFSISSLFGLFTYLFSAHKLHMEELLDYQKFLNKFFKSLKQTSNKDLNQNS